MANQLAGMVPDEMREGRPARTRVGDGVRLLLSTLDAGPAPEGFEKLKPSASAAMVETVKQPLAELEAKERDIESDATIAPSLKDAHVTKARDAARAKIESAYAGHAAGLARQIEDARPKLKRGTPDRVWQAMTLSSPGMQAVVRDPLVAEVLYLDYKQCPPELAQAFEDAPPSVEVREGGNIKIRPLISDAAKTKRAFAEAPRETVSRYEGLRRIASDLSSAKETLLRALRG